MRDIVMNYKNDYFIKLLYDFSATLTSVNQNVVVRLSSNGLTKVTASGPVCGIYL